MSRLLIFQPHTPKYLKKLLAVLNIITQFRFRDGTRDKKNVFNNTSNRIKNDRKMNHNHYSLTSLKQPGKYLKNCFFNIGFRIFRQVIGIPMGSDSVALFFANQFVLHHESECVCKMKNIDHHCEVS